MRFPKLSNFFHKHKRSQSDSALSRRARPVTPTVPAPRPVSASFADGIVLPSDYHPLFLPEGFGHAQAASFLCAGVPPISTSTMSTASATHSSASHISAASHSVIVDVLTRRIQELEDSVRAYEDGPSVKAVLETELESLRDAVVGKAAVNEKLASDISVLCSEVDGLRQELEYSKAHEKRLSSLIDIPVIKSVVDQVAAGEDAEDALVDAVKEAIKEPDSTWRRLLEPVAGPRSPEAYIAQVNCTLRARKDGRDWRKKAGFWKHSAKEDGRHMDTVTPSVSQLSDIIACSSTRICSMGTATAAVGCLETVTEPVVSSMPQAGPSAEKLGNGPVASATESSLTLEPSKSLSNPSEEPAVSPSASDAAGAAQSTSASLLPQETEPQDQAPLSSGLPPLASVTFRESYSIRSLPSKRSSLVSSSSTMSRIPRESKSLKPAQLPVVSKPISSRDSASALNPISIAPAPANAAKPEPEPKPAPTVREPALQPTTADTTTESPTRSTSTSEFGFLSSLINRSFSFASIMSNKSVGDGKNQAPASPLSPTKDAPTLTPQSPLSPVRNKTSTANTIGNSSTSPTKSRLPLPTSLRKAKSASPATSPSKTSGKMLLRRLSKTISKPVLVDSTNAAAVGDSSPGEAHRVPSKQNGVAGVMGTGLKKPEVRPRAGTLAGKNGGINISVKVEREKEKENVGAVKRVGPPRGGTLGRKTGGRVLA